MAAKRRKIVSEDFDLGNSTATIPTDSGGTRAATQVGLHTFTGYYGSTITAASVITPGTTGKNFNISGSTAIDGVNVSGRTAGWEFRLIFTNTGTITHAGSPASGVAFALAGSVNLIASSGGTTIVECLYDGAVIQAWPVKTVNFVGM